MHDLQGVDWRPSMVGTFYTAATGYTFAGAPIACEGFSEALLLVTYASLWGTATNAGVLTLKVQEAASIASTGSAWSDITDGEVMGSFKVAASITSTGTPFVGSTSAYERIVRGSRKKYLRVLGTIDGTAGQGVAVSAGFLLGVPISTLYIARPTSVATGNSDFVT